MEQFLICYLLKRCGLDEVSNKVFEMFASRLDVPTKISFDGRETPISYEELICGFSEDMLRFLKMLLSCMELFKSHKSGIISEENLIFNQGALLSITNSLKDSIINRSEFIEGIKYSGHKSIHLLFRSLRYGISSQLIPYNSRIIPLIACFCKKFIRSNFIYAHQHMVDSEFGLGGEPASIYVIRQDRTGNVLISGGDDGIIRLWNIFTGNLLLSIRRHAGDIIDIDINSCNTLLASCCGKGQLMLTLLSGNSWIPIAIMENTDRLTYVRFAYSKQNIKPKKGDLFHETEVLISASDNAIITIYKVSDIFIHGVSHHFNLMKRMKVPEGLFKNFQNLFEQYRSKVHLPNSFDAGKSLFYKAPPLYKIDIFPLSPKAFDIYLNPLDNRGFSSDRAPNYVFFSIGAALQSLSSTEEIQINISGRNIPTKAITIQKHTDKQGYSLVFMVPLDNAQGRNEINLIDMPQNHGDHPDVSFANHSNDLVTASDDGTVILWVFSHEKIYSKTYLSTYISDRILNDSYTKKKSPIIKVTTESSSEDSDYSEIESMDEGSIMRRNPIRTSRFIVKNDLHGNEDNRSIGIDCSSNMVQFIDSVQWSCDDSIIFIAHSVTSKGVLRRSRNSSLVSCIECCISYFARNSGRRYIDAVLPGASSRISCLIPHPLSPGIVLSLTYNGGIFVISDFNTMDSSKFNLNYNVLFEHRNANNPYLNGIWLNSGLGFIVSQKYGSFEIYNVCNMGGLNRQVLSQSYRFNFPEQFFLNDFSEILRDDVFGWIDPNMRKPIYMMPRSIIVDRNKRMYPENVQPPTPKESPLGIKQLSSVGNELLAKRIPIFSDLNGTSGISKAQNSKSIHYMKNAARRYIYRKKIIEGVRCIFSDARTIPNDQAPIQYRNVLTNNEEPTWASSQSQNDGSSGAEIQSYSSDSSNDEDFDISNLSNNNTNRGLRNASLHSPTTPYIEGSSSLDDSSLEENDCDSDLTSEDSLYNEIKGSVYTTRSRCETKGKRSIIYSNLDIDGVQKEIEFRYYTISNLNTIWSPDQEETKGSIMCKLCNKSSTTISGYQYLTKSEIEFNSLNYRPVLHGVNGSIDLGPLIGPFDYRYSTHKLERNTKVLIQNDHTYEDGFYIHTRCLITIPFLHWEIINDHIYTNLFDIMSRIFKPSQETPPLPKKGLTSTFFDSNVVKFPNELNDCSYCHEYGASILCQGNKCSRQFHYHCSSLAYHSFPETVNSSFISPRESNMYWCDIMQFYLFYCPKCIHLKQSNVPYCPKRENMVNHAHSNNCSRSWLLAEDTSVGYVPQINDYLYFFPSAYICSGLDDIFFKNILEAAADNKKSLRRSTRKLEFIKCKLIHISYAFPNDTEKCIKTIITLSTETSSGNRIEWQIRCIPNDGPDYLVLEDEVEKGIHNLEHRLRVGQENYIFMDSQWHEVIIKNIKPSIIWESVEVSWKQDESSGPLSVSPWEIHESVPDIRSGQKILETSDDLIKIFVWIISQNGPNNPLSVVEFFKYPIPFYSKKNLSKYGYSSQEWVMHYWKEIPLPFSFISIIHRIRNNFYRRIESLVFDVFLVRSNCEHFNMNNNHLIQGIRSVEYELLRLIFSKRLPRYIVQANIDTSPSESEFKEKSSGHSSTIESDDEIVNQLGKRRRRRL
ncbi:bromo and PHD domain-containing protein [Cryptosporidium canis]|uniref:Bromo and PHD domain-containing protein n=1 Tax=Cryptosporidium canis TaxID=195482 RepID=A0ABQ8PAB9_9CRYT|nr:bromo and PHD domain-containing protein [Cryptosporidium canis]